MSKEPSIQEALALLHAEKFSFRISDFIRNQIDAEELKIAQLQALLEPMHIVIMKRDLRVHLLEKEVVSLNTLLLRYLKVESTVLNSCNVAKSSAKCFVQVHIPNAKQTAQEALGKAEAFYEAAKSFAVGCWKDARSQIDDFKKIAQKLLNDIFSKNKSAA